MKTMNYKLGNFQTANLSPSETLSVDSMEYIGNFLGTDNMGLRGNYYVMDAKNFKQGMSHQKVGDFAIMENLSKSVLEKIDKHYENLPTRPDYDGFVTVSEGVDWAKSHPNALKNPTSDNTLYLDASKLDFGSISTSDFPAVVRFVDSM